MLLQSLKQRDATYKMSMVTRPVSFFPVPSHPPRAEASFPLRSRVSFFPTQKPTMHNETSRQGIYTKRREVYNEWGGPSCRLNRLRRSLSSPQAYESKAVALDQLAMLNSVRGETRVAVEESQGLRRGASWRSSRLLYESKEPELLCEGAVGA